MVYVREGKSFSETKFESIGEWKRQEASGQFPDFFLVQIIEIYIQPLGQLIQKLLGWFGFHTEL